MLNRLIGFLIICISLAFAWFMMEYNHFTKTALKLPVPGINYLVEPGSSLSHIARDLEQKEILSNALYFRILARLEGKAQHIKAGEYHIVTGTNPSDLLSLLVAGKVTSYSLTLIEGWNFKQVLAAVRSNSALKQTLKEMTPEQIMGKIGHSQEHPEGRFLPDTYHFPRGTTDLSFLKRAYNSMARTLDSEWKKREQGLPLKSPYEALILASIVEKETGQASERPMIAGVFVRRLNKGMKLQTDPTVIYGMGDEYNGNIRRKDLKADTPYNTYVHKGLTPTPISMPGVDAIRAVLHPEEGKSLYFVAKGNGFHHFSDTLKEHNRAVRKYQLKR